jgi:uncharacterized oxidoreductase
MNTKNKTILVTGGGSGIGLAIAKTFSEIGNNVIIAGRNEDKLKTESAELKNVSYFKADISNEQNVEALVNYINSEYGELDILINNAAITHVYNLKADGGMFEKAANEIATNYLSVVSLTEKLMPLLEKQPEAAIVNINAIIGLSPSIYMPTHSVSKAALRAFSQILRYTLEKAGSAVRIFEVYPPLVKTDFSKAIGSAATGIPAEDVAQALLSGLESNTPEIYIGRAAQFYQGFFAATEPALNFLNQPKS